MYEQEPDQTYHMQLVAVLDSHQTPPNVIGQQ